MTELTTDPSLRVGNAERELYADYLAECVSTGHLTEDEFASRRDKALTAVTAKDLMDLVADLPPVTQPPQTETKALVNMHGKPFNRFRWAAGMLGGALLAAVPGPVMATASHGFGHTVFQGGLAIILTVAGAFAFLFVAIDEAPDRNRLPSGAHCAATFTSSRNE